MALKDFIKSQFIEVIEWLDDTRRHLGAVGDPHEPHGRVLTGSRLSRTHQIVRWRAWFSVGWFSGSSVIGVFPVSRAFLPANPPPLVRSIRPFAGRNACDTRMESGPRASAWSHSAARGVKTAEG